MSSGHTPGTSDTIFAFLSTFKNKKGCLPDDEMVRRAVQLLEKNDVDTVERLVFFFDTYDLLDPEVGIKMMEDKMGKPHKKSQA